MANQAREASPAPMLTPIQLLLIGFGYLLTIVYMATAGAADLLERRGWWPKRWANWWR